MVQYLSKSLVVWPTLGLLLTACGAGVATWAPEPGKTTPPWERLSYTIHSTFPAYRGWVFYDFFVRVPPERTSVVGSGMVGISSFWLFSPHGWHLPVPLLAPGLSLGLIMGPPGTPRRPPAIGGLYSALNLEALLWRNPDRQALRKEGQILWSYLQLRLFNQWWTHGLTVRGVALELGFRAIPVRSSW